MAKQTWSASGRQCCCLARSGNLRYVCLKRRMHSESLPAETSLIPCWLMWGLEGGVWRVWTFCPSTTVAVSGLKAIFDIVSTTHAPLMGV